ncbi:MAG: D-glycero-beta-D-manno-heptose 1,7-bisphosphate 7-phosphatase [Alphaproteobacteria bacterium]|nr:D-glycero-beta-D-manno-heptose 1,7-bisphosphate 7-phosphatase [Alphaproteobacteria bacterium]
MGDKALFLDRDGVINVDVGYIWRPEDFIFCDGVFDACRRAAALGYQLVVVTNQAGIGRGLFSEEQFQDLTQWMCARFADQDIDIAQVFHAPTHPEEGIGIYRRESIDRKPGPGMLLKARDALGIDLAASALVGDRETDIEAAIGAGVGRKLLVDSDEAPDQTKADALVGSLAEAVAWLATDGTA